jgi:hypothetical protein
MGDIMPDKETCLRRVGWVALAVALIAGRAAAGPQTDHPWKVEVSGDRCVATMIAEDDTLFEFNALRGAVGFDMFAPKGKRIAQAAAAQLQADDHVFAFTPQFTDDSEAVYLGEILGPEDLEAARRAHKLTLTVGKERLLEIAVTGTGLDESMDAMIACSNGDAGWWGEGVKP